MKQFTRILSTLLLSVVLFVGILFTNSLPSLAAITPQEAKDIIKDSSSVQEAGDRLRAGDSFEKVRDRQELDTAREVGGSFGVAQSANRIREQHAQSEQSDKLVGNTQNKLKGVAENIKEKLNLDEPLPESTKEFMGDVKENVDRTLGKTEDAVNDSRKAVTKTEPGYYQRNR